MAQSAWPWRAADLYRLGAMHDGSVIYWQIDAQGRVRDGKVMLYGPDDNFATASRKLRRWIHDDPPLNEELRRVGYHTSQKYFSQAHFEVLREYLGEPLE